MSKEADGIIPAGPGGPGFPGSPCVFTSNQYIISTREKNTLQIVMHCNKICHNIHCQGMFERLVGKYEGSGEETEVIESGERQAVQQSGSRMLQRIQVCDSSVIHKFPDRKQGDRLTLRRSKSPGLKVMPRLASP